MAASGDGFGAEEISSADGRVLANRWMLEENNLVGLWSETKPSVGDAKRTVASTNKCMIFVLDDDGRCR